jgi:hypothetical protein
MKRSAFGGGLGGVLSDLRHRRLFRGRESRRSGSGGGWGRGSGLGSLAGSSWTFACCLRLITSPIGPAITSNVPANHEPLAPIAPEADPGAAGEPRQTAEAITRNRSVG